MRTGNKIDSMVDIGTGSAVGAGIAGTDVENVFGVDEELKDSESVLYSSSSCPYPYPRSAVPRPLLEIQNNFCHLYSKEENYNPIVDYGYPPPPKPPPPPEVSPLCSPCPSDSDEDDDDLLDIYSLPPDYQSSPARSEPVKPLQAPPLPPEFPWPAMPLTPPPVPPQFPWTVPASAVPSTSARKEEKELPEALKSLCQPLFCKLCALNLPSKMVSRNHYQRSRRHKVRVNKWLKQNNHTEFFLYVPPRIIRRNRTWKPNIVSSSAYQFEWKETESEDAVTDPFLPEQLRPLCQTLSCSICDTRHFSRTHAMDHYSSREHRFEVQVYLGLATRPTVRSKRSRKGKRSYWGWMKKHHLGSFSNNNHNKPKNVLSHHFGTHRMSSLVPPLLPVPTRTSMFDHRQEFCRGAGRDSGEIQPGIIWRDRQWH